MSRLTDAQDTIRDLEMSLATAQKTIQGLEEALAESHQETANARRTIVAMMEHHERSKVS